MPHPNYLLAAITPEEWGGWLEYFAVDGPIGPQRGDLQAGIVAAAVRRYLVGGEYKPTEFMPFHEQREQTPEEMRFIIQSAKRAAMRK